MLRLRRERMSWPRGSARRVAKFRRVWYNRKGNDVDSGYSAGRPANSRARRFNFLRNGFFMVTIKDVALRAGVPVRMAARALSGTTQGKRRDAKERAERVREAAQELGYCPSGVALALARGLTQSIGLLLPSLTDMFYAAASEIAMDEAGKQGYSISIRLTRFRPELARESIGRFRSSRVDGILYGDDGSTLPSELVRLLQKQEFPFLTFGHPNSHRFSSVAPDHADPIFRAVEMLARRGHSRITIAMLLEKHAGNQRDAGHFLDACSACGVHGEVSFQEEMKGFAALAGKHRDALLINGKYAMRAFLDSIADDPGYQPDLVGFYNEWTWAQASAARLRGVVMDQAELAVRTAVKTIIGQVADRETRTVTIPSRFYSRDQFTGIHVLDLANQYLAYDER